MEKFKQEALERMAQFIGDAKRGQCTTWSGGRDQDGYPRFWFQGKTVPASRVLWELIYGPIPEGLLVRHTCDNPECLQIEHLILGTPKQNSQDAVVRGRMIGPRKVDGDLRDEVNRLRALGMKVADIAIKCGISVSSCYSYFDCNLVKDGKYASGGRHWNFKAKAGDL